MRWELFPDVTCDVSRDGSLAESKSAAVELPNDIKVDGGVFKLSFQRLSGGKSQGVELLEIDTGAIRVFIVPMRGMGLWKAVTVQTDENSKAIDSFSGNEIGWQSPVKGPVHPAFVPVHDASGIGWLEGFDELLVRCGLESNGAPEFNLNGTLKHPLHGRIANLPASSLSVSVDPESGTLEVVGTILETRFLVQSLQLQVTYRFEINRAVVNVTDIVTNCSSKPTTMQLLYHINIGQRILEAGSKCVAALAEIVPKNSHSANSVDRWDEYDGPVSGFEEQVYFAKPQSNDRGWTTALLHDSNKNTGIALRYDTRTLPYFTLWKNTAAVEDGYVTGLEPATGFPNTKSFEAQASRVIKLAAGESRSFSVQLEALSDPSDVARVQKEIEALRTSKCCIHNEPIAKWCEGIEAASLTETG